jgi:transposase
MGKQKPDEKLAALRKYHALNLRPEAVTDPAFAGDNPFFDARDLVQVKYEMLRRVYKDGRPVAHVAAAFGFSRPSFYQARAAFQAEGLPGLLPERPGPRRAHKLTGEIMDWIDHVMVENPLLRGPQLADMVHEVFGVSVHARSIERALARRQKKPRRSSP